MAADSPPTILASAGFGISGRRPQKEGKYAEGSKAEGARAGASSEEDLRSLKEEDLITK